MMDDPALSCGDCYDIAHDEMDERETCEEHRWSASQWFHTVRYIVLRAAPGATLPKRYDGLWLDTLDLSTVSPLGAEGYPKATGRPTGRYETRDDGMSAEVYEVSW